MNRRHSEKGMALVITLLMLAVVTFMAVVFLALSRRERNTVTVAADQTTAKAMGDIALARSQAEIVSRINSYAETFLATNYTIPGYLDRNNRAVSVTTPVVQLGGSMTPAQMTIGNGQLQRALFKYDLMSSTTFVRRDRNGSPVGFDSALGHVNTNVNYFYNNGSPLVNKWDWENPTDDYQQNVANLQIDSRAPVIVNNGTNDFRYYIDLNRNGKYEPSGVFQATTWNGSSFTTYGTNEFAGDPEWIGVLEHADQMHSETNRFIGRYAFIALPMGKSLDINYIHNQASYDGVTTNITFINSPNTNRFTRNQGVGSWELNLAGFLIGFHTNIWLPQNTAYYVETFNSAYGIAHRDAIGLLEYRLNASRANLIQPAGYFTNKLNAATPFDWGNGVGSDLVDEVGDGPFVSYDTWHYEPRPVFRYGLAALDNDDRVRFWHGMEHPEKTGEIPDAQRFFAMKNAQLPDMKEARQFYTNFAKAVSDTNNPSSYYRYGFYRWLSQMGSDSTPALNGKIHLNYTNEPGTISTNLVGWFTPNNGPRLMQRAEQPYYSSNNVLVLPSSTIGGGTNTLTNFFLIAADAMLRASLVTNVYLDKIGSKFIWRTNYTVGGTYFTDPSLNTVITNTRVVANLPVRPDISVTNIQIFWSTNTTGWDLDTRLKAQSMTNSEYSPAVHRILQLAANIYDNMQNDAGGVRSPHRPRNGNDPGDPYYPTVYRPLYEFSPIGGTPTNIIIVGWKPVTNFTVGDLNSLTNLSRTAREWFINPPRFDPVTRERLMHVHGQPWVIGVKKGWPNFNEFASDTYLLLTRKLEIRKNLPGDSSDPSTIKIQTNNLTDIAKRTRQIYMMGLSNVVGLEAWNAFSMTNRRPIRIEAEIHCDYSIERLTVTPTGTTNGTLVYLNSMNFYPNGPGGSYQVNGWQPFRRDTELSNALPANPVKPEWASSFRVPIYTNLALLPNSEYNPDIRFDPRNPAISPFFIKPATFMSLTNNPDFRLNITNRIRYLAWDPAEERVIDYVSLDDLEAHINLVDFLTPPGTPPATGGQSGLDPRELWRRDLMPGVNPALGLSFGVYKQLLISLGQPQVGIVDWNSYGSWNGPKTKEGEQETFRDYFIQPTNSAVRTNITRQAPFSPVRGFKLARRYQANDPYVHYMVNDLVNMYDSPKPQVLTVNAPVEKSTLGKKNTERWNMRSSFGIAFQDPGLPDLSQDRAYLDDWSFPISKLDEPYGLTNHYRFPNIGTLGQVHRGTPWQTVYLKAAVANNVPKPPDNTGYYLSEWATWSGSYGTHPTNDWKLVGLFTTALTENAARGLLGVNQTGTAAWSAVLAGVPVITNSVSDSDMYGGSPPRFGVGKNHDDILMVPGSPQMNAIIDSINQYRASRPMGVFSFMGEILGTPMLSAFGPGKNQYSPYFHVSNAQVTTKRDNNLFYDWHAFTDEALEAIPQRVLSLLKDDEPRMVVYCFGQTLKPADRSLSTSGNFYNLCLNYKVTGEFAAKAVVRVEGELRNPNKPLRTVVESFEVLPPFE